jgi:hypothetical protein
MPFEPDQETKEALWEANSLLQQVSDKLGRSHHPDLRLRFPRGFLKTADFHRNRFPSIRKGLLQTNLGYSLMLAEVYWWLLFRTDLASVPAQMVVKAGLVLQGAIAEALLVDALSGILGERHRFKTRTGKLVELGRITEELKAELDWLWDMRNQQHLYELTASEFSFYERSELERATKAVCDLGAALETRRKSRDR